MHQVFGFVLCRTGSVAKFNQKDTWTTHRRAGQGKCAQAKGYTPARLRGQCALCSRDAAHSAMYSWQLCSCFYLIKARAFATAPFVRCVRCSPRAVSLYDRVAWAKVEARELYAMQREGLPRGARRRPRRSAIPREMAGRQRRGVAAPLLLLLASPASACPSFCGNHVGWLKNCNLNACASCDECAHTEAKECYPFAKGDIMTLTNERCMQWCQVTPQRNAQCINCACKACPGCESYVGPPAPTRPSPPPPPPPLPPPPRVPLSPLEPPSPPESCAAYTPFDSSVVECNRKVCEAARAFEDCSFCVSGS